jgi:hypothetical protein
MVSKEHDGLLNRTVLVRVQLWQPIWKAGRYKLAAPVPKTGSVQTRGRSITDAFRQPSPPASADGEGCRGEAKRRRAVSRPGSSFGPASQFFKPLTKGNPMKPVLRYQSHLLYRKSYKPKRVIRIRPTGKLNIVFRPVNRFGAKPQLTIVS